MLRPLSSPSFAWRDRNITRCSDHVRCKCVKLDIEWMTLQGASRSSTDLCNWAFEPFPSSSSSSAPKLSGSSLSPSFKMRLRESMFKRTLIQWGRCCSIDYSAHTSQYDSPINNILILRFLQPCSSQYKRNVVQSYFLMCLQSSQIHSPLICKI